MGNVRTEYMCGGDWSRALFRESLSFFGSTMFAYYGAKAATAIFLPLLAPFGWVFLIVGGGLLAGGLTAGAMALDKFIKSYSDGMHESLRGYN